MQIQVGEAQYSIYIYCAAFIEFMFMSGVTVSCSSSGGSRGGSGGSLEPPPCPFVLNIL